MAMTVGTLVAFLKLNKEQYDRDLDKGHAKFGKIAGAMTKVGIGMSAAFTAPMALIVHSAASGAAAIEQGLAKSQTVFGRSVGMVQSWAKANAEAMGESAAAAEGMAAAFGDLLVPMGFTRKQAADMATKTVGLSGALSAWTGGTRTAAEVSAILAKAMLGERDGLKELGISILDADVQARLAKNGQEGLTGAALEQAKAIATQALIFEKSTDAQAAFTDGTETLAEKQLKAKAVLAEAQVFLGNVLRPALAKIASVTMTVVGAFNHLPGPAKTVILVIAGLLAVAGPLLIGLGMIIPAITAIIAIMPALGAGFALATGPVGLIVLAIAAAIAAIVILYKKNETFRAVVQRVWAAVAGYVSGAWATMKTIFAALGRAYGTLRAALSGLGRAGAGAWNSITTAFRAGYYNSVSWINRMIEKINWLLGKLHMAKVGSITGGAAPTNTGRRGGIPEYATGGIADGPRSGYLAMLHGREAIVPLGNGGGLGAVGARIFNVTIEGYNKSVDEIMAEIESYERRTSRGI